MPVDKYKIRVNAFTAELPEPLDRNLRTLVTAEVDIYDLGTPDNDDGTHDEVYKAKLVGTTIVKQGDNKPILAKSKRTQSQKLRQAIWKVKANEDFYQRVMSRIIDHIEDIIEEYVYK